MFAMNEYSVAAEAAYRREQMLAALAVRRAQRAGLSRRVRVAHRIIGRAADAPAGAKSTASGSAAAAVPAERAAATPLACAA